MKKTYISYLLMAFAMIFGFTACDPETDEDAGGTNVEKMAGFWEVKVDAVDANGNVVAQDPYGLGTVAMRTYNTAANTSTEMWLDDLGNFYNFKFKVDVNYPARTFSATERDYDAKGTGKAVVTDGKVLEGQAKNLHGMPNDSICFSVKFSDDTSGLTYRISGQRKTGFYE